MRIDQKIHLPPGLGFGFTASRILHACEKPTNTHLVRFSGHEIFIFTKAAHDSTDVVGVAVSKDPWEAMFAFQALPDLCERPLEAVAPLQIVELMAARFGLTMVIGGKSGKFFLMHEFPVPSNIGPQVHKGQLFDVENSDNHPWFLASAVSLGPSTVRVALAFCIDIERYGEWITSR